MHLNIAKGLFKPPGVSLLGTNFSSFSLAMMPASVRACVLTRATARSCALKKSLHQPRLASALN
jgi:hypothetical protein